MPPGEVDRRQTGSDMESLLARPVTRRRLLEFAALSAGAATLAGTGAESFAAATAGAAAPVRGGTLRAAFNTVGKDVLDPNNYSDEPTLLRAFQMYDRLFEALPAKGDLGGKPAPMLAESAEPNAKWTSWRIKIRSGVTFHDGSPLTAADVVYSFKWALSKKNGFAGPAGVLAFLDVPKIRADGKDAVIVPFTQPFVYFLEGLCVAPSIVKAGTADYKKPNGTGPFKFVSFAPNQQTVMTRNDNYWMTGKPYLDGVTMILFDDASSQMSALQGGQVDMIGAIDPTVAKSHANDNGIKVVQSPSSLASYFYTRVDTGPFRDNRVREAFKLAVDREQLVNNILLGYGSIGNDLPGKGYADYNDALPQRKYDPEKAKALLKQAGHDGITVTGLTYPDRAPEFAAYKQQAKKAGIDIKLKTVPLAQYYAKPYWPEPANGFAQTRWPGTFASVAQYSLGSKAPFPETGWKDKKWEADFAKALATVDEAKRNVQMKALEKVIWQRGGLIAWGYSNFLDMHSDKIKGLQIGPDRNLGFYNFKNVWLTK